MDALKWIVIAVAVFLAWSWLRGGISATANVGPAGWGSGMMYSPGGSAMPYLPNSAFSGLPLWASYSPNGFNLQYGL